MNLSPKLVCLSPNGGVVGNGPNQKAVTLFCAAQVTLSVTWAAVTLQGSINWHYLCDSSHISNMSTGPNA